MESEDKVLKAFSDGGSDNNPGLSGWAFYIENIVKCYGHKDYATNNEMELTAMLECLRYIGKRKAVIYSDSTYVIKGLTQWMAGWKKNGWETSSGNDVANQELWKQLDEIYDPEYHDIQYVEGHSGVEGNELCDQMVQLGKASSLEKVIIPLAGATKDGSVKEVYEGLNLLVSNFNRLSHNDKRIYAEKIFSDVLKVAYQMKVYGDSTAAKPEFIPEVIAE